MNDINLVKIDWISILGFGLLILLGLGNIFSSSQAYSLDSIFSLINYNAACSEQRYGSGTNVSQS